MKRQNLHFFLVLITIITLILICTILSSCSNYEERLEEIQSGTSSLNILLISLDTVRADHLSCYGYKEDTSPNIDNLAEGGTLFNDCRTNVPLTLPSHTNILSGLYPFKNDVRVNSQFVPTDDYPLLAEILKNHGYATAAFVGAFILDSRFGLERGFDLYDDDMSQGIKFSRENPLERRAEVVNASFLSWLEDEPKQPFFAFVHFFDPHLPYTPPERFKEKYENPYDAEIAYTDSIVGKLLNKMEEMGLMENTLIILLSDHGEGLGEHGELDHGVFIYEQTLRVPLIFHCPGLIPQGKKIEEPVSLSDIMPTVLDILGIEAPNDCDGRSLAEAMIHKKELTPQPIYHESLYTNLLGWSPLYGITYQGWKYIQAPFPELYNLEEDPGELDNLYDVERKRAGELAELLLSINEEASDLTQRWASSSLDSETIQNLQSLGYISSGSLVPTTKEELIDPKDKIEVLQLFSEVNTYISMGENQRAFENLLKIIEIEPNIPVAYSMIAPLYLERKELDKAEDCALKAIELDPISQNNYLDLALIYMHLGKYSRAEEIYQNLLNEELIPKDKGYVYANLAKIARVHHKDLNSEISLLEKAHQVDPENADILYHLIKAMDKYGSDMKEMNGYISQFNKTFPNDPRSDELDALIR